MMYGKEFYTAYTKDKQRFVIIYVKNIKRAHMMAQEYFGKGISFTTRKSTNDETLHADPNQVLRCE